MGGPADERVSRSLHALGDQESLRTVASALVGSMPFERRAVFALAIEQRLSYAEIAQRLRLSEDAIKLHIRDGLTAVRRDVLAQLAVLGSPRRDGTAGRSIEDHCVPAVASP